MDNPTRTRIEKRIAELETACAQMAALIIQAARRWATASDRIDAVYLRARTAIDGARDVADVLAVLRAIPHTL